MSDLRHLKVLVVGALAMLLAFTMPSFSSATFTSSSTSSMAITSGTWDNTPPKVTLLYAPGLQVSGTQSVIARASDPLGSGVKRVDIKIRRVGTTQWTNVCPTHTNQNPVAAETDYACSWQTGDRANDSVELQAVAIDAKGHESESQIVTTNVANGPLTLTHPGLAVTGPLRLTATASPAMWMTIYYATANTDEWRSACSTLIVPRSTLTCEKDLPVGTYDVYVTGSFVFTSGAHVIRGIEVQRPSRSAAMVGPSRSSTSGDESILVNTAPEDEVADEIDVEPAPAEPPTLPDEDQEGGTPGDDEDETVPGEVEDDTVPGEVEDDTVPGDKEQPEEPELRGAGIDVANGGGVGSLDEGDTFTVTFSGEVDLTTVLSGWSGETTAVSVRLRDGNVLGGSAQDDTIDVFTGELPVELGHLTLGADVIVPDQEALLSATMTAASVTVDDQVVSTITITLGPVADEAEALQPATTAPALVWTPSAAVTDLAGRAVESQPVLQTAGGSF